MRHLVRKYGVIRITLLVTGLAIPLSVGITQDMIMLLWLLVF